MPLAISRWQVFISSADSQSLVDNSGKAPRGPATTLLYCPSFFHFAFSFLKMFNMIWLIISVSNNKIMIELNRAKVTHFYNLEHLALTTRS